MMDRVFQKVPWWAAALAIHVVLLVQAMVSGARGSLRGEEELVADLAGGRDLDVRLQAPDPPEFGPEPERVLHDLEEEIIFRDVDVEGLDDGFV